MMMKWVRMSGFFGLALTEACLIHKHEDGVK
jgi:hypothetical protein